MKIAIISMFGHYECLFFLCEILQEHKVTLYIANNTRGEEEFLCKIYSNFEKSSIFRRTSPTKYKWDCNIKSNKY